MSSAAGQMDVLVPNRYSLLPFISHDHAHPSERWSWSVRWSTCRPVSPAGPMAATWALGLLQLLLKEIPCFQSGLSPGDERHPYLHLVIVDP